MNITDDLVGRAVVKGGPVNNSQLPEHPVKIADIPEPATTDRCSRCGKTADHKFNMFVKPNTRAGKALVARTYAVCERCAAFLVFEVQKVFER